MPPRIQYPPAGSQTINVDLVRAPHRFNHVPVQRNSESTAGSGVEETLEWYTQDHMTYERKRLTGQEIIELARFFEFARDGSSFSWETNRNIGCYIPFEGNSLNTMDGVAPTFTRAATGYYRQASNGLFVTAASGAGRFPAGKYGNGLLLEGAYTNLITHPSDFTSGTGAWNQTNCTVTGNSTELVDPAGNNESDKLAATANNGNVTFDTSTAVGNDAAFNVWLRAQSDTAATIRIEGTTAGTSIEDSITVTPEWQNFSLSGDTSSYIGNLRARILIDTSADVIYAYDAALYDSMEFAPPISPNPTATSSASATGEVVDYATSNIIGQNKGTIMFWFKPQWTAGASTTGRFLLFVDGVTSPNRHMSYFITGAGAHELRFYDGTGTIAASVGGSATSDFVADTWTHVAITYDAFLEEDTETLRLYINGSEKSATNTTTLSPNPLSTNFNLGSNSTSSQAHGIFDDFYPRKDVFSAKQISNIYNAGRGIGLRRNRWTTCKVVDTNFNPNWNTGDRHDFVMQFKEVLT